MDWTWQNASTLVVEQTIRAVSRESACPIHQAPMRLLWPVNQRSVYALPFAHTNHQHQNRRRTCALSPPPCSTPHCGHCFPPVTSSPSRDGALNTYGLRFSSHPLFVAMRFGWNAAVGFRFSRVGNGREISDDPLPHPWFFPFFFPLFVLFVSFFFCSGVFGVLFSPAEKK